MKHDVSVKNSIVIPDHEITITTSRAGGPGGQHVNKTNTRVTIHWNVITTTVLTQEQKQRVLEKLQSRLTAEGELVLHNNESRSQLHNKKMALLKLAEIVRKALHVPKKRRETKIPAHVKESRFKEKSHRSALKKIRSKKISEE